ncbi:tRNA (adenine(22)-N(1))-methyltransferase [Pediococcus siamensis]|uniref:tRNA (adenine(22)-N(1))-methyltransferase n=1 Tax=Pediococcus siamensis TaxID=381829 RepID=UPI0039A2440D
MNANNLSKRLQLVADSVSRHARLADIGSDHAYLPVYLAQNHIIEFAIAGEVAQGPHQNATNEITKAGLETVISSRLGDGLAVIQANDHINTVTIAGMGGTLIANILEAGKEKLAGVSRLILQPNVGEDRVRRWLMQHDYRITGEQILAEDRHIYEIIVADRTSQPISYTDAQLLFGPLLLEKLPNSVFTKKWQAELQRVEKAIKQMKQAQQIPVEHIAELQQKSKLIKKVLQNEN